MKSNEYVVSEVDTVKFALPSVAVDRVERAVMLTPVPEAPAPVLGVVNDAGIVVPVLGLRGRLGNVERDVVPSDRLVFSSANGRRIALLVDHISDVIEVDAETAQSADEVWKGVSFLKSFAGVGADVILVQDLGALLDSDQERDLTTALASMAEESATDD